jgi:hypothetical protein
MSGARVGEHRPTRRDLAHERSSAASATMISKRLPSKSCATSAAMQRSSASGG